MKKNKNKNKDKIILSEYKEEIDILADFWRIHKSTRGSYYNLIVLKNFIEGYTFVKEDSLKLNSLYKSVKDMEESISSFEDLDNIICNLKDSDFTTIFELELKSLILKGEIDGAQENLLDFIYESTLKTCTALANQNDELNNMYISRLNSIIFSTMFDKSHEIDKIVSYTFNIDFYFKDEKKEKRSKLNSIIKKYLNENNILKVPDYSFNIELLREKVVLSNQLKVDLISSTSKLREESLINKLNKKVSYATILATAVALLSLLYTLYDNYEKNKIIYWSLFK